MPAVLRTLVPTSSLPVVVALAFLAPSLLALVPRHAPEHHAACSSGGCCIVCKLGKSKSSCHGTPVRHSEPVLSCGSDRSAPVTIAQQVDHRVILLPVSSLAPAPPAAQGFDPGQRRNLEPVDREPPVPPPRFLPA